MECKIIIGKWTEQFKTYVTFIHKYSTFMSVWFGHKNIIEIEEQAKWVKFGQSAAFVCNCPPPPDTILHNHQCQKAMVMAIFQKCDSFKSFLALEN